MCLCFIYFSGLIFFLQMDNTSTTSGINTAASEPNKKKEMVEEAQNKNIDQPQVAPKAKKMKEVEHKSLA